MTKQKNTDAQHGRKHQKKKGSGNSLDKAFDAELSRRMESCPTAEDLNAQVITPFIQALVTVCDARGYVLNIYGENCNLAITPEDHAEALFQVIEDYLDQSDLG